MFREKFWQFLGSFPPMKKGKGKDEIHSVEAFRTVIENEMNRYERIRNPFSLVIFNFEEPPQRNGCQSRFVKKLYKRKRLTDEVGWFIGDRIGVMLPDTQAEGAEKFTEDILSGIRALGLPLRDFSLYTYPSEKIPGGNGRSKRKDRRSVQESVVEPTPSSNESVQSVKP